MDDTTNGGGAATTPEARDALGRQPAAQPRPSGRGTPWLASCLLATLAAGAGAAVALGAIWLANDTLTLASRDRAEEIESRVAELGICESAVTATLASQSEYIERHELSVAAMEARIEELTDSARRSSRFLDGLRLLLQEIDATATATPFATSAPRATAGRTTPTRRSPAATRVPSATRMPTHGAAAAGAGQSALATRRTPDVVR